VEFAIEVGISADRYGRALANNGHGLGEPCGDLGCLFSVWGLGFRVQGSGFRVQNFGFRV
jgi:hypothetical protein